MIKKASLKIEARPILPRDWVWSTLGESSEKPQYGWTTRASHEGGELKLLRTTDITSGTIDWNTVPYCTEEPEDVEKYLVESGDILISRAGSVGVSFLLNNPKRAVFASYLIRFRAKEGVDPKYFYYYLKSSTYWSAIGARKSGIAVPNVNASKLAQVPIPLAPPNEQKLIVTEIEKQFSRLDKAVASLKRTKANLKRYKAAVLKAAVEGRLTEEWRTNHPEIEPAGKLLEGILTDHRIQASATIEQKVEVEGAIFELPVKWVWCKAHSLGEILDPQPSHRTPKEVPGGVPYIGMGDVTEQGKINFADARTVSKEILEEHRQRYRLAKGNFIFGKIGTLGAPVLLPEPFVYTLSANVVLFQPNSKITNPRFVLDYMRSPFVATYLSKMSKATSQPAFGIKKVREMPVPLPPLEEQNEIVAEVEHRLSVIDELEAIVEANLSRTDGLRQSVLQQAFSGRLTPENPNVGSLSIAAVQPEIHPIMQSTTPSEGEARFQKEIIQMKDLLDALTTAGDWISAQEAFRHCGISAGAETDAIERIYEELRCLVESGRVVVNRQGESDLLRLSSK